MSQESAFQYFELAGEHRVMREIADVLIHVCIDIYLVFCSLRNAPRYRHLLNEIFEMASFVDVWLENLGYVVDNASYLAIIYDALIQASSTSSRDVKKYIDACLRRTQSQRSLHLSIERTILDFELVLDQFNRRMHALTRLLKESPEGAEIAARIHSLNYNVDRLLSMTSQLLFLLSLRNSSFEAHLQSHFHSSSIKPSESEIQLIKTRCYNSSLDLVALREELKEQQSTVKWNLDRLSSPFEPTKVRASDYFGILRNVEFLEGSKEGSTSVFSGGRVAKLKQWFTRIVGTRNVVTINV